MFTSREFDRIQKIEGEMSVEMAEMAMFTIDLGAVQTVTRERGADGRVIKKTVKPTFPHLVGMGVNLWEVTPYREELTLAEAKKLVDRENELDRQAKLANYIQRVASGLPVWDETDEDEYTPQDEWEKFFADDEDTHGRGGYRCGRMARESMMEAWVDNT